MENILIRVYNNKKLFSFLKTVSHISALFIFLSFCLSVLSLAHTSYLSAVKLMAIILLDFLVISLTRRFINAPRPYEIYDFYETPPRSRRGLSFPSRHTFMAFAIAVSLMPMSLALGIVIGFFGAVLAVSRVLVGIHFIRDVLAGALLGVIASSIGLLILFPH